MELLVILAVVLLMVGPGKVAGLGKALGQSIREFKGEVKSNSKCDHADNCQAHTTPQ